MTILLDEFRALLPAPYRDAVFTHRRRGLFDDPKVDVFTDAEGAFTVLHPGPVLDYTHYVPRQQKLGLGAYKKTLDVVARPYAKVADLFPQSGTVLEIGAAEGGFLAKLKAERSALRLVSIEPDLDTKSARSALGLAGDFANLAAAEAAGARVDLVCFFHVFEHIADPRTFLDAIRRILVPGGRILIEVPSLDDPLLSLYALPAYEDFYFQRQHPFVYSSRSLSRVLEAHGWTVCEIRPYQRYGMENHLNWLRRGGPGGDVRLAEVLAPAEDSYRAALESKGMTDTVFAIAEPR